MDTTNGRYCNCEFIMKNYIMKLNVIITLITIILFSITLINIIRQTIKTLKQNGERETENILFRA